MKKIEVFVLIISLVFIIYNVVPILAYFVKLPLGFINIFTFAALLIACPRAFLNRGTVWVVVYISYLFLSHYAGRKLPPLGIGDYENMRIITIESAFILPNIAIANVLLYYKNIKLYKWIAFAALSFILAEFLYLTPILLTYKNALRSVVENYVEIVTPIPGLPTYSLTHAYIMLLAPLLFGVIVLKGKIKYLFAFLSLYFLFVLFSSSVATNIFLACFLIIASFVLKNSGKTGFVSSSISFLVIGFLLFFSGLITELLNVVISALDGSSAQSKLIAFRDFLVNGEMASDTAFGEREGLHKISVDAFFSNPLVGSSPIGEHSSILDRLGGLGLLGFVPYAMIFYCMINRWFKNIKSKLAKTFYVLGLISAFLLLYQKGLFGQECWLLCFVLLPVIIIVVEIICGKVYESKRAVTGRR